MASQVYKTLAKIVGIVLILGGAVAIFAGNFTGGFIKSQLEDQAVVLPTEEAIDAQLESGRIQQEDADALAEEVASLNDLRYSTLLDGNTLRGMLLNAYGWGMIGTIATWAGIGAIVFGLALTAFGFLYKGRKDEVVVREDRVDHA